MESNSPRLLGHVDALDANDLVSQLWDDRSALPFEEWAARAKALIARQDPTLDAGLFHSGYNLFSHPDATPEFTRDILLIMALHPDYAIRARLDKVLSQGRFKIPEPYLRDIEAEIRRNPDQAVKDVCNTCHAAANNTLGWAAARHAA